MMTQFFYIFFFSNYSETFVHEEHLYVKSSFFLFSQVSDYYSGGMTDHGGGKHQDTPGPQVCGTLACKVDIEIIQAMLLQLFRLTWKVLVENVHFSATTSYRLKVKISVRGHQLSAFFVPFPGCTWHLQSCAFCWHQGDIHDFYLFSFHLPFEGLYL